MSTEAIPRMPAGLVRRRRKRKESRLRAATSSSGLRDGFALQYVSQATQASFPLWLADQAGLVTALAWASVVVHLTGSEMVPDVAWLAMVLALGLLILNISLGLYPGVGLGAVAELRRCTLSTSIVFGFMLLATALSEGPGAEHCLLLGVAWGVAIGLMPAFRQLARRIASKTSWWGCPLLVLGGDAEGAAAYRALLAAPELGLRPVGVLDELHQHWAEVQHVDPSYFLGTLSEAPQIARHHGVFWGVVSMARHTEHDLALVLDRYAAAIPHLLILPQFGSPQRLWQGAHEFGDLAGLRIDERLLLPLPRLVKRTMDLALVLLGSVLVLPICAAIALAIRRTSPGPIFYGQKRVGFGGEKFTAWKFRSMVVDADQVLEDYLAADPARRAEWDCYQKLKNDPRVTWIGRFIRKTSLDELPQLWNVLLGEMSLVGPRPMTPEQVKEYPTFHLYTRLRPGITGLWQISGRNSKTFQQRAEFDATYVRNWSPWLDLVVLVRTIKVVLFCEGSY